MIAVDTNIIVRLVVKDDARQLGLAEALLPRGFYVSHGVLMETEWVLRSVYGFQRPHVLDALRGIVDLEAVTVSHRPAVLWALDRFADGADWADMLHLIAARGAEAFATFEARLSRAAGPDAPVRVELLQ